jgi:hypothetical protein
VAISDYFIIGYWWLFHYKPLVDILLLVDIDGYFINGYEWLLHYKLLFFIICYITTIGDYCIIDDCLIFYVIMS